MKEKWLASAKPYFFVFFIFVHRESLDKGGRSAGEIGSFQINQTHSSEKNEMRVGKSL